jgi:hypothetical protein
LLPHPNYLIFIVVIRLKDILTERMTVDVADTIFSKFGVNKASSLDKGQLKKYYIALVKRHHPDVGGSNAIMRDINSAYEVLSTAEAPDTSEPADLWGGRSMPKNPKTKGALRPVNLEFRMGKDNSVITYGIGDYFDVLKIVDGLVKVNAEVSYDPFIPIDQRTGEWLAPKIIVYIETPHMTPDNREVVKRVVRKLVRTYCAKGKFA